MTAKMTAVGYAASLPISEERSLFEFETPVPQAGRARPARARAGGLGQSRSTSRCACASRGRREPSPVILGWDAAGIVEAVGPRLPPLQARATTSTTPATSTVPAPTRPSTWSTSASSAASRSRSSFAEAAALPLTTLTAWELMFDRIGVKRGEGADRRSLLIVGGAGGVGSIAIQLARKLTGLTVIATASRPQTRAWVKGLGAHHVDRPQQALRPAAEGLRALPSVDIVLALTGTPRNAGQITEVDRAAGPSRADRGHGLAQGLRHGAAVVEMREPPSRADVHPLDLRHPRHDRAAPAAERGGRPRRPRRAAHDR